MRSSEVAKRYSKALFDLAIDNRSQEKVFSDLRSLDQLFSGDKSSMEFLTSPMVPAQQKEQVLKSALENKGLSKEVYELTLLLARNDRFAVLPELVSAFEKEIDASNNVTRGVVRSATALGQEERSRIEKTVEEFLKKKVIMTYKVDPSVIGGLVAQVGSYTFDDSIQSHLTRMNEELKRRMV
jgi:F-type H+-transporting ATPase subunit delta